MSKRRYYTEDDVRTMMRKHAKKAGSIAASARVIGMDRGNYSRILSGIRPPDEAAKRLFGLTPVTVYTPDA